MDISNKNRKQCKSPNYRTVSCFVINRRRTPPHSDRHYEQRLDVFAKRSSVRSAPSDVGGLRRSTCVFSKAHVPSHHRAYQSGTGVTPSVIQNLAWMHQLLKFPKPKLFWNRRRHEEAAKPETNFYSFLFCGKRLLSFNLQLFFFPFHVSEAKDENIGKLTVSPEAKYKKMIKN